MQYSTEGQDCQLTDAEELAWELICLHGDDHLPLQAIATEICLRRLAARSEWNGKIYAKTAKEVKEALYGLAKRGLIRPTGNFQEWRMTTPQEVALDNLSDSGRMKG